MTEEYQNVEADPMIDYQNVEADPLEVADETDDSEMEEVEPEAWPLDRLDTSVEGSEGYNEEVVEDGERVDPFSGVDDFSGEEDQA